MKDIINLTPHAITVVNHNGNEVATFPASGIIARVSVTTETIGEINGIPITTSVYSDVVNLPDPREGTIYIVSSLVAKKATGRNDLYIPNESVRDSEGNIIGCRSLGKI